MKQASGLMITLLDENGAVCRQTLLVTISQRKFLSITITVNEEEAHWEWHKMGIFPDVKLPLDKGGTLMMGHATIGIPDEIYDDLLQDTSGTHIEPIADYRNRE